MSDNVNKPRHYAFSEIECIDYLKAIVPFRSFIDHCRMSAIAYITRSPHKGSEVEDIDKAINYLQRARNEVEKAIEQVESEKPSKPQELAIPEGWRELEENEPLSEGDLFDFDGEWVGHEYDPSGGVYSSRIHRKHIRKIETEGTSETPDSSKWIPKVGDKVRVVRGFMNPIGDVGIVKDFCPVVNGNFSILAHEGRCTLGWFKKDDVELIEAAQ